MTKKQKRHTIASIGTVLFMILLFLLLWLIKLTAFKPEEEEGVEVAFGEVADAGGYMAEQSEAVPMPAPVPAAPQSASSPSDNDLMTQEDEESLALRREQEKKERERKEAEAAEKQRQREEQARLEEERKAREAAEAAQRAKEAEAIAKANQFGSLFGQTGNTQGSGSSQGSGQRGNPAGHGSSGGHDWSLNGRDIKGEVPQPIGNFKEDGRVVVQIRVNARGDVVSAKWTDKGTQNANKEMIKMAEDAARKAKFTEGEHDQIGTITYIFKLN